MKKNRFSFFILLFLSFTLPAQVIVTDIFNRNLSGETIRLVDWEGYIANPAIKLTIQPPVSATFPFSVNLTANHPRLYFNMSSTAGINGPSKTVSFSNSTPREIYLSIFPDRAGGNENYTLTLTSSSGTQNYNILVLDHDSTNPTINFNILTNFSQDIPTYNFFANPTHTAITRQAADDWAFFIKDMNFNNVAAGSEQTWIWTDDFASGAYITNSNTYNGFLLYAYGIHTTPHRSGGEASTNAFQTINSVSTGLRRSGGYEAEAHGNYNTLGWNTTISDNTWYLATNLGNVQNDLYSISLHELGHALGFYSGYPVFQTFKTLGTVNDPAVLAYQLSPVPVDQSDHLSASPLLFDRISRKGAFGSEYANQVPYGRWLITKLNLLVLKSIGYDLKPTSAFRAVGILPTVLPNGSQGSQYTTIVSAEGGVPFYKFEISAGTLPPGLGINSFDGNIAGVPSQQGVFTFTVKVTDYDNESSERAFTINIDASTGFSLNAEKSQDLQVFPNPFQSLATIVPPADFAGGVFIIYNMLGEELRRLTIKPGQTILPRENLSPGIYLYRLLEGTKLIDSGKLVVEPE